MQLLEDVESSLFQKLKLGLKPLPGTFFIDSTEKRWFGPAPARPKYIHLLFFFLLKTVETEILASC